MQILCVSTTGMSAGLPKFVTVNLSDIALAGFEEGEEVSLESLKSRGILNPSGRLRRLRLKVMNVYLFSDANTFEMMNASHLK